jgi:ribosome-interacting GTPase 1
MDKEIKHIRDIIKKLPIVKAANDFVEKLERKIKDHESKISKSKRKSSSKSSKG